MNAVADARKEDTARRAPRLPKAKDSARKSALEEWGRTLRQAREDRGWTQAELARRTGLDKATIHNLERGNHAPSHDSEERIKKELKVPPFRQNPWKQIALRNRETYQGQIAELQKQLAQRTAERDAERAARQAAEARCTELEQRLQEKEDRLGQQQHEQAVLQGRIEQYQVELRTLQEHNEQQQQRQGGLLAERDVARAASEEATQRADEQQEEIQRLRGVVDSQQAQLAGITAERDRERAERQVQAARADDAETRARRAQKRARELEAEVERMRSVTGAQQAQLVELSAERSSKPEHSERRLSSQVHRSFAHPAWARSMAAILVVLFVFTASLGPTGQGGWCSPPGTDTAPTSPDEKQKCAQGEVEKNVDGTRQCVPEDSDLPDCSKEHRGKNCADHGKEGAGEG